MNGFAVIEEAVKSINAIDEKRKAFSETILEECANNLSESGSGELLEPKLAFPVKKAELNCRIAACDSGFVTKQLLSMDLILVRAVGALFEYGRGKVVKACYIPNFYSFPEPRLQNKALELDELNCSTSLHRLFEEIDIARQLVEKHAPAYCLLDGSIIPQYADKPRKDSKVRQLYRKLVDEFQALYGAAEKNNCVLLGCIEDSRGSRFRTILQQALAKKGLDAKQLDDCFDSVILDYLLRQGQRSFAFKYSGSIKEHPILMDFEERWSNAVHAFYLKPAAFDRPLRVEFLHQSSKALTSFVDSIASVVFALSCSHREYGYPGVLIESDLRARLQPQEVQAVYDKIIDKLGKGFNVKLRRERRPF